MTKVYIKDWFLKKMQAEQPYGFILENDFGGCAIERETEKAYFLSVAVTSLDGEYDSHKNLWCPKKCTETAEEHQAAAAAQTERFRNACSAYDQLVAWAKEHGVKGIRKGMKKITIMGKIKAAGLEYSI